MAISSSLDWNSSQGWLGPKPTQDTYRYTVVGDRVEETKDVVVHEFRMGDVEDPDLYAAQPLWEWQESDAGKWIMENAVEPPCWHRQADPYNHGYQFVIRAKLQGARLTEWLLRKQ